MPTTTPVGTERPARESATSRPGVFEAGVNDNLLVAATLIFAIFLLVVGRKLLGVDSWLTLMAGREIIQHGLPHREAITTIPLGRTWTDQQWLAQVVFYGLHRSGGLGLALLFHSLMVTTALAVTMVASRVRGASSRMTLVAAIVCLVVAPWSWQLRAQSIALPLFACTLALMSTDPRMAARRTFLVFPILGIWANVHGSVVAGATIVSLGAFLALFERLRRKEDPVALWRSALFLFAPWACVLVSPYGTDLVGYYRLLFINSPVPKYITEWQAPEPRGYFLAFFAAAVATLAIAIWKRRRLSAYDLGVLALTLAGACRSVRAVVWFSLALAMLLPLALDGIVRPRPAPPVHRRLAFGLTGLLAGILAATAVFTLTRPDSWFERDWSRPGARAVGRAALASDVQPAVWSSGTYSDWLLWKEPTLRGRLAWDVRVELLTEAELRSIVLFNSHKPGWRAATRGYPLLVLDRRRHPEQARDLQRERGTDVLFADESVVVLARNAPR